MKERSAAPARSGLKAQVHAVLAKQGVRVPMSGLFGVAGRRLLDGCELANDSPTKTVAFTP